MRRTEGGLTKLITTHRPPTLTHTPTYTTTSTSTPSTPSPTHSPALPPTPLSRHLMSITRLDPFIKVRNFNRTCYMPYQPEVSHIPDSRTESDSSSHSDREQPHHTPCSRSVSLRDSRSHTPLYRDWETDRKSVV